MKGKILKTLVLVGVLTLVVGAGQAWAQGLTTQFQVSATVGKHCTIEATALDFGTYNPLSATPRTAESTVTVRCTRGTPVSVALDGGSHELAGVRNMRLTTGPDTLPYRLYLDSGYLTEWNSANVDTFTTASNLDHDRTVYGRLPAGADVTGGSYTDSVTATLNF
ncbi:MAG: spore coat protein U domain-containing protein [Acidobacteria bacterium]|nr:spore coat protein U domain-containing protein [Acidobacteriota bacterium]